MLTPIMRCILAEGSQSKKLVVLLRRCFGVEVVVWEEKVVEAGSAKFNPILFFTNGEITELWYVPKGSQVLHGLVSNLNSLCRW